jgi:glycosyltransferase involved in cell wall biosynthesis
MLSGNLLIGADAAGTRELVKSGRNRLLYPLGDHEKLAETIQYACTHREEMRLLAEAGRKYMFENMTAQINADNVLKVYQEIIKNKKIVITCYLITLERATD